MICILVRPGLGGVTGKPKHDVAASGMDRLFICEAEMSVSKWLKQFQRTGWVQSKVINKTSIGYWVARTTAHRPSRLTHTNYGDTNGKSQSPDATNNTHITLVNERS